MSSRAHWPIVAVLLFMSGGFRVQAATLTLTPEDDDGWTIIESAAPGDVVEIAPGTYRYRVYLSAAGSEVAPIVIRAQDPEDRPVWDLVGDEAHPVDSWPGSYTAGDRHRGGWQVAGDGAYYEISDIVFRNCRASSSAGMRMINSGPVTIRNCLFEQNTNGLTGASEDLVVESCEFRDNGKVWEGGNMTHNIYIYGGRFTMRYCFNHDPHEGQLFHVRARESILEYNWLARPSSYVGDIMTCEHFCGSEPISQHMILRGNVILQGTPENRSQLIALYNDADGNIGSMNIDLLYNTIIGTPRNPGQTHALVHMVNEGMDTHATFYNNIVYDVGNLVLADNAGDSNWSVSGGTNWLSDGADDSGLPNTLSGSTPGFSEPEALDFSLLATSAVLGQADTSIDGLPDKEYYLNETVTSQYRERLTANDLGAFEGPAESDADTDTDTDSDTDAEIGSDSETNGEKDAGDIADGSVGNETDDDGSCSCRSVGKRDESLLLSNIVQFTIALIF